MPELARHATLDLSRDTIPFLATVSPWRRREVFPLVHQRVLLGGADECEVQLRDRSIEARHAVIEALPGGVRRVSDLSVSGQTLVNGRRLLQPVVLEPGDRLKIGDLTLRFDRRPTGPWLFRRSPGVSAFGWVAAAVLCGAVAALAVAARSGRGSTRTVAPTPPLAEAQSIALSPVVDNELKQAEALRKVQRYPEALESIAKAEALQPGQAEVAVARQKVEDERERRTRTALGKGDEERRNVRMDEAVQEWEKVLHMYARCDLEPMCRQALDRIQAVKAEREVR